jgi:hypothetical protein
MKKVDEMYENQKKLYLETKDPIVKKLIEENDDTLKKN